MKFDVSCTALSSRLQAVSKVIASKNSLPILDNFMFQLEGEVLTITASDAETHLVTTVPVMNAQGTGSFTLEAKKLMDPLKELPEQPLTFDINDGNLEIFIYFQNGKYNFIGTKADTYPTARPLKENVVTVQMEAKVLLGGINRTIFATADDELRPVMNGIFFDMQPESLTFVASDGRKLVRLQNRAIQSPERASFILPKKPANLLKNLLAREEGNVLIRFDENNAQIECSSFNMVCRLIEGRYPNYNSVIPQDNPYKVTIDRVSFLTALKRVSVFSQASSLIKLQIESNTITIFGQDIDFSIAAEERVACEYTGPDMQIGFNAVYLMEILSNIGSQEVVLQLADRTRAGVIVPAENEENEDLLTLLMPMMLND